MTGSAASVASICNQLNRAGARYLVVGERAVQFLGGVSTARGLALLIEPTRENTRRVLGGLAAAGVPFASEAAAPALARAAVVVLGGPIRVEILMEGWPDGAAATGTGPRVIEREGVPIPVASPDLLAGLLEPGRPRDDLALAAIRQLRHRRRVPKR